MFIADALSRAFLEEDSELYDMLPVSEIETQSSLEHFPFSASKLEEYVKETDNDVNLRMVKKYVLSGWPVYSKVPNNLKDFWNIKNTLILNNGLLLKDNNIIVPFHCKKKY